MSWCICCYAMMSENVSLSYSQECRMSAMFVCCIRQYGHTEPTSCRHMKYCSFTWHQVANNSELESVGNLLVSVNNLHFSIIRCYCKYQRKCLTVLNTQYKGFTPSIGYGLAWLWLQLVITWVFTLCHSI